MNASQGANYVIGECTLRDEVIPQAAIAEEKLVGNCRSQHARVAQCRLVDDSLQNVALAWKGRGCEVRLVAPAVAAKPARFVTLSEIDAHRKLIRILNLGILNLIVGLACRRPGNVGLRIVRHEQLSAIVQPVQRNLVIWELRRRNVVAGARLGERVVDLSCLITEVKVWVACHLPTLLKGWNNRRRHQLRIPALALVIRHEEEPVRAIKQFGDPDRTAQRKPELVPDQRTLRGRECGELVAGRVHHRVANKVE